MSAAAEEFSFFEVVQGYMEKAGGAQRPSSAREEASSQNQRTS